MAFVDMRMKSGWDGIETIGRIWRECSDLQIIICTGHNDFTWHDIIQRFGHTDRLLMLKKPFNVLDLRQMAYALAEKWNLFNQAKSHLERLQNLVAERTAKLQESNESLQRKILEQKQAEQERRMMEIQLRHAQKLESVGQLAAGSCNNPSPNSLPCSASTSASSALSRITPPPPNWPPNSNSPSASAIWIFSSPKRPGPSNNPWKASTASPALSTP
jgi:YesN/AraC family two-component response regulator